MSLVLPVPIFSDIGSTLVAVAFFTGGGTSVLSTAVSSSPVQLVTPSCGVYASGGQPPYAYAWEDVANPNTFITDGALTSNASWRKIVPPGNDWTGTFKCKVTDMGGTSVYATTITVELEVDFL